MADEPKSAAWAVDGNYFDFKEGFFEIGNWTSSFFTGMALLAWRETEDDYAQKARDILIAWANTHTSFGGNESALDLGDYAVCYGGGASILRGTWPGWTKEDTTTVKNYFLNVLLSTTNWQDVAGTEATSFISIPPTNGNAFFRLVYPVN